MLMLILTLLNLIIPIYFVALNMITSLTSNLSKHDSTSKILSLWSSLYSLCTVFMPDEGSHWHYGLSAMLVWS